MNDNLIWTNSTREYTKSCNTCGRSIKMVFIPEEKRWTALHGDAISLQTRGRASLEWAYGKEDKHTCTKD